MPSGACSEFGWYRKSHGDRALTTSEGFAIVLRASIDSEGLLTERLTTSEGFVIVSRASIDSEGLLTERLTMSEGFVIVLRGCGQETLPNRLVRWGCGQETLPNRLVRRGCGQETLPNRLVRRGCGQETLPNRLWLEIAHSNEQTAATAVGKRTYGQSTSGAL